jgi:NO-binding membrane sensor protein with MHYT domain
MESLITSTYDPTLLVLSFTIAVVGSWVGLMASRNIVRSDGKTSWFNAMTAGVGIGGIGVWAMHFIGMLALKFDLASGYALVETLVSLLAAIAATTLALVYVSKAPHSPQRIITAGIALGLGVCVMHYLGMYGMRFNGFFRWSIGLVALSIVIALVAATAALWLATRNASFFGRLVAAIVMGVAVCAMHYTGMAAADIICTSADRKSFPVGFGIIKSYDLPTLVIFSAITMAAMAAVDQFFVSLDKR